MHRYRTWFQLGLISAASLGAFGCTTAGSPVRDPATPPVFAATPQPSATVPTPSPAASPRPVASPSPSGPPVDPTLMPANTQSLSYGLRIADLTVGTGATPTAGQTCTVHYTGWLKENGKQFETSVGKTPYSFQISRGGVIRGWDEGIITMKVGGKRKLEIPPLLAYGESGANGVIPSNATLIFDIELLSVK